MGLTEDILAIVGTPTGLKLPRADEEAHRTRIAEAYLSAVMGLEIPDWQAINDAIIKRHGAPFLTQLQQDVGRLSTRFNAQLRQEGKVRFPECEGVHYIHPEYGALMAVRVTNIVHYIDGHPYTVMEFRPVGHPKKEEEKPKDG